jgi:hypothetical protein
MAIRYYEALPTCLLWVLITVTQISAKAHYNSATTKIFTFSKSFSVLFHFLFTDSLKKLSTHNLCLILNLWASYSPKIPFTQSGITTWILFRFPKEDGLDGAVSIAALSKVVGPAFDPRGGKELVLRQNPVRSAVKPPPYHEYWGSSRGQSGRGVTLISLRHLSLKIGQSKTLSLLLFSDFIASNREKFTFIPVRWKWFLCYSKRADLFWGPPTHPFNAKRGFLPRARLDRRGSSNR